MSSCNSLAIRVRSVSCASINLRLKAGNGLFGQLALGDVGDHRKGAGLTIDLDQFGGTEGGSNLTILSTNRNLQISDVPLFLKFPYERSSLIWIHPQVDLQRRPTDNLVSLPTGGKFERLVNFNVATIADFDYADGKRTLSKHSGELFFRFSKFEFGLPSSSPLPEQSKN